MKTILPNRTRMRTAFSMALACLCAATARAQSEAPQPPVSSPDLLAQAAATLAAESSFQADFRHRVTMLGQEMLGKGVYRQANHRRQRKYRLEITLRVGEESSSVQQASNGRFLWIRRDFPGQRSVVRLDLREVRQALRAKSLSADAVPTSIANPLMGYEGLPGMFTGLAERFDFAPPRETTIGEQPAWLIEGRWKKETVEQLAPGFSVNDPHLNRLPEHVPTHVAVILSRSPDWPLFPYRIEYRRARETFHDSIRNCVPQVTMEFYNVLRRPQFDAREFEFPPADDVEVDITSEFIERLSGK